MTVAAIRAAWIEHGVLFFRDQDLTDGEHSKFCARFGVIQAERTAPESESEEHPGCLFVSNFKEGAILPDGEMWFHSDQCYFDLPVSADLENGFGDAPAAAAETVRGAAAAGLAGCSIEDASSDRERPLMAR